VFARLYAVAFVRLQSFRSLLGQACVNTSKLRVKWSRWDVQSDGLLLSSDNRFNQCFPHSRLNPTHIKMFTNRRWNYHERVWWFWEAKFPDGGSVLGSIRFSIHAARLPYVVHVCSKLISRIFLQNFKKISQKLYLKIFWKEHVKLSKLTLIMNLMIPSKFFFFTVSPMFERMMMMMLLYY